MNTDKINANILKEVINYNYNFQVCSQSARQQQCRSIYVSSNNSNKNLILTFRMANLDDSGNPDLDNKQLCIAWSRHLAYLTASR